MIQTYVDAIDDQWKSAFLQLMQTIDEHIPDGFEKTMQYNMVTYVVPLSYYEKGYHVTANTPLPFISLAAQKRHLALYHIGIYACPTILKWFQEEYAKTVPTKLNMGKSCIRWTSTKHIPYELIGELVGKMTVDDWIRVYEEGLKR